MRFRCCVQLTVTILSLYLSMCCGESISNNFQFIPPTRPTDSVLQNNTRQSIGTPTCTTSNVTTRNGVRDERRRWVNFRIQLDPLFEKWEQDIINNAMWNLQQVIPCVNFGTYPTNASPTGDYIRLIKGTTNGCNSQVGRIGGQQIMNLQSPGCVNVGTVMHEMLHALGFDHEHNRHDRDDYVNILLQNVDPAFRSAFTRRTISETTTYGVAYNYNSIMHYEGKAFSINNMSTITAKNGQQVGTRGVLQQTDIQKLKAMYNCNAPTK